MKKRIIAFTLTIAMIGCLFVGCGLQGKNSSDDGKTTITFWDGNWSEAPFKKIMKVWAKEHPDIVVKPEFQVENGMADKYILSLKNGTAPDVMACALDWVTTYGNAGMISPLDEFVKKDKFDTSEFVKGAIDSETIRGKLCGLPFRNETYSLFYNKDLFRQAGVTKVPETWDEVIAAAKQCTKGKVAGYGLTGTDMSNVSFQYITMLRGFGGDILNQSNTKATLNTKAAQAAMQTCKDLIPYAPASFLENKNVDNRTLFASGKIAMYMSGTYDAPEIAKTNPQLNFGCALTPLGGNNTERNSILGGWSVVISKNSKEKAAAWEFVKFITRPDIAKIYSNTFTGTGEPSELYDNMADDIVTPAVEGLKYATALPAVNNIVSIRERILDHSTLVMSGESSVKKGSKDLNEEVNSLLN